MMDSIYLYIKYYVLFIIGQTFAILTAFITLPYEDLTIWESYKMAIPYAWAGWIFTTKAIEISHSNNDLFTPNQILFSLILIQFVLIIAFNYYYLGKIATRSDIISFILIFFAYIISSYGIITKILKISNIL
jgi:hypothetical protein